MLTEKRVQRHEGSRLPGPRQLTFEMAKRRQLEWSRPPGNLVLATGEVQVWRAALDLEASRVRILRETLTSDERSRADRFRFPDDCRSYVVARAVLRGILARYVEMDPARVPIRHGPLGKPELGDACGERPLNFNLSHSHHLAVYAVTMERQVGIDVEHIRPVSAYVKIVERFFSPLEASALRAMADDARQEAFFACWTRKEAYVKARGVGLSSSLRAFSVSLDPGHGSGLLETTDGQEPSRWSIHSLNVGQGYAAALAVDTAPCQIRRWEWCED